MATRRATRIREPKPDRIARLSDVPAAQLGRNAFTIVDVANHSEADQRHSVRSRQMRTVRRKTHMQRFREAGVLTPEQAAACEWYQTAWELGFGNSVSIANYEGMGGASGKRDHLANSAEQARARDDYAWARQAIPSWLLPVFEGIILTPIHEQMVRKIIRNNDRLGTKIRLAADLLYGRVNGLIQVRH